MGPDKKAVRRGPHRHLHPEVQAGEAMSIWTSMRTYMGPIVGGTGRRGPGGEIGRRWEVAVAGELTLFIPGSRNRPLGREA